MGWIFLGFVKKKKKEISYILLKLLQGLRAFNVLWNTMVNVRLEIPNHI